MSPPGAGLTGQWGRRPIVALCRRPFLRRSITLRCGLLACSCTHTHTRVLGWGVVVVSPGLFPWGSVWLILHFHFPPFPGTLAETKKSGSHVLFLPGVRAFVEVFASPGQVRRNLPQGPLWPFCHLRPQDSVPPGRDLPSRCAGSPGPGTAGGRAGACLLVKDWAPAGTVEG